MTEGSRCAEKVAAAYRLGRRDALEDAVQRVEALFLANLSSNGFVNAIIAAIKGDQP
jgi:hypothetical protein